MDLDADIFVRLVSRAQTETRNGNNDRAIVNLERALALWRGTAGGADVAGSSRLLTQLDSFNHLRLIAREDLISARLVRGEHRLVVPQVRALLADHPYREVSWGQLMYAYYCCGDIEAALRTYLELRKVLDEELGVEPGQEVGRLHQAILARDDTQARRLILPEPDRFAV
ncbi:AfsR/SARP family transcriptional regulator [Streptomyces sp. AC550_RSS872]|uniref:AfsR/SARP family transcriptional regulator n=1 Tax=Streptomyces sp. AC550_RSS872 TaxID=2823689 RepID=UPI0020B6F07C|nr:AfsR/SARP family transcriptional regulator [Streptomyces sp. AC550_RSS872]